MAWSEWNVPYKELDHDYTQYNQFGALWKIFGDPDHGDVEALKQQCRYHLALQKVMWPDHAFHFKTGTYNDHGWAVRQLYGTVVCYIHVEDEPGGEEVGDDWTVRHAIAPVIHPAATAVTADGFPIGAIIFEENSFIPEYVFIAQAGADSTGAWRILPWYCGQTTRDDRSYPGYQPPFQYPIRAAQNRLYIEGPGLHEVYMLMWELAPLHENIYFEPYWDGIDAEWTNTFPIETIQGQKTAGCEIDIFECNNRPYSEGAADYARRYECEIQVGLGYRSGIAMPPEDGTWEAATELIEEERMEYKNWGDYWICYKFGRTARQYLYPDNYPAFPNWNYCNIRCYLSGGDPEYCSEDPMPPTSVEKGWCQCTQLGHPPYTMFCDLNCNACSNTDQFGGDGMRAGNEGRHIYFERWMSTWSPHGTCYMWGVTIMDDTVRGINVLYDDGYCGEVYEDYPFHMTYWQRESMPCWKFCVWCPAWEYALHSEELHETPQNEQYEEWININGTSVMLAAGPLPNPTIYHRSYYLCPDLCFENTHIRYFNTNYHGGAISEQTLMDMSQGEDYVMVCFKRWPGEGGYLWEWLLFPLGAPMGSPGEPIRAGPFRSHSQGHAWPGLSIEGIGEIWTSGHPKMFMRALVDIVQFQSAEDPPGVAVR